ncbi:pimeloyl-[acyl-carrier protein] methyl ester esterase [Pseudoalteromonas ruthenica]|uniref:Pimeloyl-[acyl-carrier protein] methyl ester esterase n=1 Tax=Pseudoalteromonas ruthenica TaxID=151081 RepID=A0A5S3Z3Q2_9GAMM|nr:pimeloyl-ACP methyl ester esterase BioH [Pseudoalteromonas ruthenica]TMP86237.1 pimeloyl-[acyl-carrier protein] methyl ester esterase [Pseudoalteromonas ruthenica]
MQKQLVLLHGWGMNNKVWELIRPELNFLFDGDVRALDLPGYGESQQLHTYDLPTMSAMLAEQLQDNSVIVGWSLGGLVALYLAYFYPHKVSKVILVASTPFFAQQADWPGIKTQVLGDFSSQLLNNSAKTIERFLAIQAMGSDTARADTKQLKALLKQAPPPQAEALRQGLDILQHHDLRHEFAHIKQPVGAIFGRLDALVPYKAIAQMQALRSDLDIAVLDKASHAPFISHKDEFLATLKSML